MPTKYRRLGYWALLAGLVALLLSVDRVSKWLVIRGLPVNESWAPIPALSKIFTITHVQNTGVAFGQFQGFGWIFMVVNLAVLVGVLIYYPRIPAGQWQLRLAAALIVAGDLGNLIDRIRRASQHALATGSLRGALSQAYVTDMFDFKLWPVFNVADLCVVTGVIIVAWTLWQAEKNRPAEEAVQPLPPVPADRLGKPEGP